MNNFKTDMDKLRAMKDEDIDTSEIPEVSEEWFKTATLRLPKAKKSIPVRTDDAEDSTPLFPSEVAEKHIDEGKSLVRAWREYKGLSQNEATARMGVSQSAYQKMEQPERNLRNETLRKIANAFEIDVELLTI